ncbi:hypothetical protein AJ79_06911 [Helicocarpus griseus UAMH5409]|uniref:Trichothecene 3-O-acetyltransferase-like N-terminal domain-containing protein n=1 Tax=Helicocarpus griseus UAMH5409 TaxID=1447875 RepID=A0A2B7X092_9EURO|nr:hypothetical protein AJ79_06911 [Helicocarpus griseus UAMH5409]
MAADSYSIGLTPMDHLLPRVYVPYILIFNTADPESALHTIKNGVDMLVSKLPWLAGNITTLSEPSGPQNRVHIVPLSSTPEIPMLQVKYFDRDEDWHSHHAQSYIPLPTFIPVSQQRPVLRFQANIFPSKVVLATSYMHVVFDGTGFDTIVRAFSECCKDDTGTNMPITKTIAANDIDLRKEVSSWSSKCQTRLDHSREIGLPMLDSNVSAEQWGAIKSAMSSPVEEGRLTFCPRKIARIKSICVTILSQKDTSAYISTNDIITAAMAISIDRVLYPDRASTTDSTSVIIPVNLRSRVSPPLPNTYLGNMIYSPIVDICHPARLDTQGEGEVEADLLHLAHLALRIRTSLDTLDETVVYSLCAAVADEPNHDWAKVEAKPADITISSWRGKNIFALGFGKGLGSVEDFETHLGAAPGLCILMPARTRLGPNDQPMTMQWEVCAVMKPGGVEGLRKDRLLGKLMA